MASLRLYAKPIRVVFYSALCFTVDVAVHTDEGRAHRQRGVGAGGVSRRVADAVAAASAFGSRCCAFLPLWGLGTISISCLLKLPPEVAFPIFWIDADIDVTSTRQSKIECASHSGRIIVGSGAPTLLRADGTKTWWHFAGNRVRLSWFACVRPSRFRFLR